MDIKIIGDTNHQTALIGKICMNNEKVKPFILDEFFVIEDENNNNPICKVIETSELDLFDPSSTLALILRAFDNPEKKGMKNIYVARVQVENEIIYPIDKHSTVRTPTFNEIQPIFYTCNSTEGLPLGCVKSTEYLYNTIPKEWNNICEMNTNTKVVPQYGAPFVFDYRKMEQFPHIGLFGGSGSGKTFAMKVIAEELIKNKIPSILLDPHYEMEFSEPIDTFPKEKIYDFKKNVDIFYVGESIGIRFEDISTPALVDIMRFSGEMTPPMISSVHEVHHEGEGFITFREKLKRIIDSFQEYDVDHRNRDSIYSEYSTKIAGLATLNAISWRINSLERDGVFNSNIEKLEESLNNRKMCIIRGPIRLLNVIGSYIANSVYEKRRRYVDNIAKGLHSDKKFVPFIILTDEAHSFAPADGNFSPMSTILETISKEGRKYGVFEILATQRPKLLNSTIRAMLSTKFIFRTVSREDLETIKKETDLDPASIQRLPFMSAGSCFISSAINGKCLSVKIKSIQTKAKTSGSVFDELEIEEEKLNSIILAMLPIDTQRQIPVLSEIKKRTGLVLTLPDLKNKLEEMTKTGEIKSKDTVVGPKYFF